MRVRLSCLALITTAMAIAGSMTPASAGELKFPEGAATASEVCGECHQAIYWEFTFGFGSDIHYKPTTIPTKP